MNYKLQYKRYNENAILIDWPALIDKNILENILNFKLKIENNKGKQIVEVITAYSSLLIIYKLTIDNVNDEFFSLKKLYALKKDNKKTSLNHWRIPVCYDPVFGTDLEAFAKEKKLLISKVIELHTKPVYSIYFLGFLPGFLYLGGLDKHLFLDRKKVPKLDVKKGAVAIGGNQTGIYPKNSPGGWHVIGNSPIELFNPNANIPCELKSGDTLSFYAITKSEYYKIAKAISTSNYQIKPVLAND